jgi:hypothetical protein
MAGTTGAHARWRPVSYAFAFTRHPAMIAQPGLLRIRRLMMAIGPADAGSPI